MLVALTETDTLLSLSGGAVLPGVLGAVGDGNALDCWPDAVPIHVVRSLTAAAGVGGVVALRVRVNARDTTTVEGRQCLSLPISVSRIAGVAFPSAEYLRLFEARVADFPDVVLSVVPLVPERNLFAAGSDRSTDTGAAGAHIRSDEGDAAEPALRQGDKVAGAIVGLLAGLAACPQLPDEVAKASWSAAGWSETPDSDADLMARVGTALSIEAPEQVARAFTAVLVNKLQSLGTSTGFDPEELLASVVKEVRSTALDAAGAEVLERFAGAARSVLRLQPDAPRDILSDSGSVMLRGALAFLQTPELERLLASVEKGVRVGSRVGCFALMLAGYYAGVTALPRAQKAEPLSRLISLGDLSEARLKGASVPFEWRREVDAGGRPSSVALLAGRPATRRTTALPSELEVVARVVERERWTPEPGVEGIRFTATTIAGPCTIVASTSERAPIAPATACVELVVAEPLATRNRASNLTSLAAAAGAEGVALVPRTDQGKSGVTIAAWLAPGPATEADVEALVGRLSRAVAVLRADAPARRAKKPAKATQAEPDAAMDLGPAERPREEA